MGTHRDLRGERDDVQRVEPVCWDVVASGGVESRGAILRRPRNCSIATEPVDQTTAVDSGVPK